MIAREKVVDSNNLTGEHRGIDCLRHTPILNKQMDTKIKNVQQDFTEKISKLSKLISKQNN